MFSEHVPSSSSSELAHLEAQAEMDTRHPDYPLWLLAQTQDTVLALLRYSGILLTEPLCAELARWIFGAAIVSRCAVERMTTPRARLMVTALTLTRLLTAETPLHRRQPRPFEATPEQLDILEEYARSETWKQPSQPTEVVEMVRDAVLDLAVRKLSEGDALLVGLLRTIDNLDEARLALDVEEGLALRMLWGAWTRLQAEVKRIVEARLRQAGRRTSGLSAN